MRKGQEKTNYKARNGKLLMLMSEEDHARIAKLISKWLAQDETNLWPTLTNAVFNLNFFDTGTQTKNAYKKLQLSSRSYPI